MKQYATHSPLTTSHSPLSIIKGNTEYKQQLQFLTGIAWQIAYTALWNGQQFSAQEKENAKELIKDFISQSPNPRKAYTELVQRVLLARQYITTHPGTYAPVPSQWFSPSNANGFAGTLRWYRSVEESRRALPLFKITIKAFAEAVLEIMQSNKAADFHYWRNYFAEQNAQATLNLFLSTMANCQYAGS